MTKEEINDLLARLRLRSTEISVEDRALFYEAADALDKLLKDATRYRWLTDCAGIDFESMAPYQLTGHMSYAIDMRIELENEEWRG